MFCGQKLKYIALFLLLALIIFGCGKEPADPVFDNPNDPLSPNYTGNNNTNTGQSQLPSSITGKDGAPMILIPAGEFQMGSNEGKADEKPVHTIYLDDFYIDKYEITNVQYRKFVNATGHSEPSGYYFADGNWKTGLKPWTDKNYNGDNQPIVCVSWEDAKAYSEWAGKRLPTEAEWEKSARGNLIGKKYTWGNEWTPPKGSGNFADESARQTISPWVVITGYNDGYIYTAPIGSYNPNGYGLYDMAGNVWEWCEDYYSSNYYSQSPKTNPVNRNSVRDCVHRGGSWHYADLMSVSSRGYTPYYDGGFDIGFRCAMDVPK